MSIADLDARSGPAAGEEDGGSSAQALGIRGWVLVAIEGSLAAGATYGGLSFLAHPDGSGLQMPTDILDATPFDDFRVPGLVLLGVNGAIPAVVAVGAVRRRPWARRWGHLAVGAGLTGWMAVQLAATFATTGWPPARIQVVYGSLGVVVAALGAAEARAARRSG